MGTGLVDNVHKRPVVTDVRVHNDCIIRKKEQEKLDKYQSLGEDISDPHGHQNHLEL